MVAFTCLRRVECRQLAEVIVSAFLGEILAEIYRSQQGISALANRAEQQHSETMEAFERLSTEIRAGPASAQSSTADARASAVSASREAHPEYEATTRKIATARELIDLGHIRDARRQLEGIGDRDSLPADLEFRIVTNLGACSLAEDNHENACVHFEAAYRLQPDNPKAVTNAAIAGLLRNDVTKAMKLAHEALELEPRNGNAAAVMIEALWDAGDAEELQTFIDEHAWVSSDRHGSLVLAEVRAKQGRFDDAIRFCRAIIEDDPDDAGAYLMLSQSLFAEAQASFARGGSAENTAHNRLAECVDAASGAIDILGSTELKSQLSNALVGRGFARALQGHIDNALDDLSAAIREAPDDSSPVFVRGLVMMLDGQYDKARDAFERVRAAGGTDDVAAPLAEAYLRLRDPLAARDLIRGTFEFDNPGPADLWKAELVCRVDIEAEDEDPAWQLFEESLCRRPEDPWLLSMSAIRRQSLSDFEGAEECFLKALSSADVSETSEIQFRLGNLYREMERFSDAADAYMELVGDSALHPLAVDLLMCLAEGRRLREALSWAREIRDARIDVPKHVIDTEAQLLEIAGDLPPAVSIREQICARADANATDRLRLALLQFRVGLRDVAARTAAIIEPSDLRDEPRLLLELARLKLMLGVQGALEDAYVARRIGIDDADNHGGYVAVYLVHDHEMEQPEVVAPGCAVQLRNELTDEVRWWLILADADERGDPHALPADHELGKRLLGLRKGDVIELRRDLEELSYEIMAIQNKFVRAFQETMDEFSTRFPGDTGLSRIVMEEGDFTKLFQATERRAQYVRSAEEMYRDGALPFATFSSLVAHSPVEVWRACTGDGSVPVRFAIGNLEEAALADGLLPGAKGIVLDLLAVLTVHELNLAKALRDRFEYVAVPQHVVDELQATYTMATTMRTSGHLGKTDDGRYVFSDRPEDSVVAWRDFAQGVLEYAEALQRVPAYEVLELGETAPAVEALTISGVGTIFSDSRLDDTPLVMVSDDLGLATLARAMGRQVVNSQGVLNELRRSGVIDDEAYSSAVGRLTMMHYTFVRIRADDILRRLEVSGYISNDETRAMLSTLRGPDSDQQAAVAVATEVMSQVFDKVPVAQSGMLLELIMDDLCQGRPVRRTLTKLKDALASDSRLDLIPWRRDRVLDRVDAQLQLRSDELV